MKLIIGLILVTACETMAQPGSIPFTGILTARNGDPIPGCNVILKGTTRAATTQNCGEFKILIPNDYTGVIIFSCLTPRVWEIPIRKFRDKDKVVIALTDWDKFENAPCEKNYKKEKRIKIY